MTLLSERIDALDDKQAIFQVKPSSIASTSSAVSYQLRHTARSASQ